MMRVLNTNDPFIDKVIIPVVKSYRAGREKVKLDIVPIITNISNTIGNRTRNGKTTVTNNKILLVPTPDSFNEDFLRNSSSVNKRHSFKSCDDYFIFIDSSYYDNVITPHLSNPEECINMQNELATSISRQMVYRDKFKINMNSMKNDFDMIFNSRESFKISDRMDNEGTILFHMVYVTYLLGAINLQMSSNNPYLAAKDDFSKLRGIVANMSFFHVDGYISIIKNIMQESDRNTGFDISKLLFLTYLNITRTNNPSNPAGNSYTYENRGDTTIRIDDMLSIYVKDLYSDEELKDLISLNRRSNYDIENMIEYIREKTTPKSEEKRYVLESMELVLMESSSQFFARKSDLPSDIIDAMKEYDIILATIHAMRTGRNAKYMVDELYDIIHTIASLKEKYKENHNYIDELDALDDNISSTITKMNNRSYEMKIDMTSLGIPEGYRD